jgi:hypothetical protein
VHFVLDARATHWPDIERLDAHAIERAPRRFVGGRNSWIAQTFVRLRGALEARGLRVTAGPGFARGGISVVHRDDLDRFGSDAYASFLVAVRADRAPVEACDIAIAQNALDLRANERYLPLWPQPGLVPRDGTRGERIETLAYFGRTSSAPAWFRDPAWHRSLRARGVRFEIRTQAWHDYREVDVALAARDEAAAVLATKPATKLYNGWLARVPVLATAEPAYAALRKGALDFLEIDDAASVLRAIERLREPALYRAMVANGTARASAFGVDAVAREWLRFFDDEVLPAHRAWRAHPSARRAWFLGAMLRQKVEGKVHRLAVGVQRRLQRAPARQQVTLSGSAPDGMSLRSDC